MREKIFISLYFFPVGFIAGFAGVGGQPFL